MRKRGRPPHPDLLTPRESEVLELIRDDLTNEQVAARLGISLDGAKYHVSEILSKLSVSSREEAAAWRPEQPRRPWRRAAVLPLVAKGAGLAFTAAAIAGLVVLALGVVRLDTSGEVTVAASDTPPLIGDHWHAEYEIWICGEKQPILSPFSSNPGEVPGNLIHATGILTLHDGIIHLIPGNPGEHGSGASLGRFFDYGGGFLTKNELRMPGTDTTYTNDDTCPDGTQAALTVQISRQTGRETIDDFALYVPQDGDRIIISFGP